MQRQYSQHWTRRFLELAGLVASWSKDPSTKCGAVIVNPKGRVVGLGYNGFPDKISDNEAWYADRETKYEMVIHAEVNAILNATASVEGCEMYVTGPCCPDCSKFLIQAGITRVCWTDPAHGNQGDFAARWAKRLEATKRIFTRAQVTAIACDNHGKTTQIISAGPPAFW